MRRWSEVGPCGGGGQLPTVAKQRASLPCCLQCSQSNGIDWLLQDVTLRLIAERLLCVRIACQRDGDDGVHGLQGELARRRTSLPKPRRRCQFHLYASPNNPGAAQLIEEMNAAQPCVVEATARFEDLEQCERVLVYLTAQTWTRGEMSAHLRMRYSRRWTKG